MRTFVLEVVRSRTSAAFSALDVSAKKSTSPILAGLWRLSRWCDQCLLEWTDSLDQEAGPLLDCSIAQLYCRRSVVLVSNRDGDHIQGPIVGKPL